MPSPAQCPLARSLSPRTIRAAPAASPRLVPAECSRGGRGGVYPSGHYSSNLLSSAHALARSSSARTIRAAPAVSPRLVPAECSRGSHGGAATPLHGISATPLHGISARHPRRRLDPPPRRSRGVPSRRAAASTRRRPRRRRATTREAPARPRHDRVARGAADAVLRDAEALERLGGGVGADAHERRGRLGVRRLADELVAGPVGPACGRVGLGFRKKIDSMFKNTPALRCAQGKRISKAPLPPGDARCRMRRAHSINLERSCDCVVPGATSKMPRMPHIVGFLPARVRAFARQRVAPRPEKRLGGNTLLYSWPPRSKRWDRVDARRFWHRAARPTLIQLVLLVMFGAPQHAAQHAAALEYNVASDRRRRINRS